MSLKSNSWTNWTRKGSYKWHVVQTMYKWCIRNYPLESDSVYYVCLNVIVFDWLKLTKYIVQFYTEKWTDNWYIIRSMYQLKMK